MTPVFSFNEWLHEVCPLVILFFSTTITHVTFFVNLKEENFEGANRIDNWSFSIRMS